MSQPRYTPTFLVEALDGRKIWRTRDYRVRYAGTPGIWEFSVLDNGARKSGKRYLARFGRGAVFNFVRY